MANDFKRFVKKDIGTGEGASGSTVYTVPSSSSTERLSFDTSTEVTTGFSIVKVVIPRL